MKFKTYFLPIIILLLVSLLSAQRGGGSSRSKLSKSSSSSRSYTKRTSHIPKSQEKQITPLQWGLFFAVVGGFTVYTIYGKVKGKKQRQTRRITDAYERNNEANMCILDQDQRNNTIDWFMNSKWTIHYKSGTQNNGSFTLKITDIVKRTDFVYEIQACGEKDQLGNSDIKGILLFQNNYLSICFDKVYDDRQKAGQNGKWSVLVYEGIQQGEQMIGRWYFEGFEGNNEYSGEMKMIHE